MFSPFFCKNFKFPKDDFAPVRICMKLSCCWPENDTWWKKIIRVYHWPVAPALMLPFMVWFILTEAKKEGLFIVMQGISDSIAMVTAIVRAGLVLRHTKDIYKLTKTLETDFKRYEENQEAIRSTRSRPAIVWMPSLANAFMCLFSSTMCLFALMNPGVVKTSARVHSQLEENHFAFRIVITVFILGHYPFSVLNVVTDGLIICSASVIQQKAAALGKMLGRMHEIKDHEEQDKQMNKIVEYHTLISQLHKEIETMCSGPLLVQVMFLVISVGSPILGFLFIPLTFYAESEEYFNYLAGTKLNISEASRRSKSDLSTTSAATLSFLTSYILWSSSQLTVYCLMCDSATSAGLAISKAAYGSYMPDMNQKVAKKLILMMVRAERPLHFTARGLMKINRILLLKLLKRSYSLYSAILGGIH